MYWKHGGAKFDFYERPSKDCYEHAVVQLYYEGTTTEILTKYLEVINVTEMNQKLFNQVASAREIKIIDLGITFADFQSPQLKVQNKQKRDLVPFQQELDSSKSLIKKSFVEDSEVKINNSRQPKDEDTLSRDETDFT